MDVRFKIETHQFGDFTIRLKRVTNLDELIEQVSDEEFNKDERLPYWAELWPSALGLARFLVDQPELIRRKSVLELGVGLGLTSIVLHKLNPKKLLLTDYEADALKICKENFQLNGLLEPETKLLDWRHPDLNERFDCIVASDVLYEERFFEPLMNMFENFLNPRGSIILAEPNRAVAKSFFAQLKERGFGWQSGTVLVPQEPKPIRVTNYVIRPK